MKNDFKNISICVTSSAKLFFPVFYNFLSLGVSGIGMEAE